MKQYNLFNWDFEKKPYLIILISLFFYLVSPPFAYSAPASLSNNQNKANYQGKEEKNAPSSIRHKSDMFTFKNLFKKFLDDCFGFLLLLTLVFIAILALAIYLIIAGIIFGNIIMIVIGSLIISTYLFLVLITKLKENKK